MMCWCDVDGQNGTEHDAIDSMGTDNKLKMNIIIMYYDVLIH